jgi:hypothetical protein
VPGKSTVTWQRLLEQAKISGTVHNQGPDSDAIIQVTTTTLRLRLVY